MHTVDIDAAEVTALLDAPFLQDLAFLSPDHGAELKEEYRDTLDDRGLCTGAVTCYLIRTPAGLALVDSGIGPRKRKGFPTGRLDEALREAGVRPDDIDLVIHTHLHVDHVGWNTYPDASGDAEIFFPNAQFVIQRDEWDYWMTPDRLDDPGNGVLRECVAPVQEAGRLQLVDPDARFFDAIGFLATPGHTPGHVAVVVGDGSDRALIIGDSCHHPFQVTHPDWASPMDVDADLASRTRARLYDAAAEEQLLVMGGHWAHPGWGRIARVGDQLAFQPGLSDSA